jgi:hypothetical protein
LVLFLPFFTAEEAERRRCGHVAELLQVW